MEHIVRGKTVVRIAEELVISENTVRMHSKRIYAKLDIHKKQELLVLIDQMYGEARCPSWEEAAASPNRGVSGAIAGESPAPLRGES